MLSYQIIQFRRCLFSTLNINIFRYLEMEIALAISVLNDEKYNWNNLAGQGLRISPTWKLWIAMKRRNAGTVREG